ncbi:hypothetical protein M409DRAFT_64461 [Zasmidium cellare ATCC 36951]|uniref:Protein phosphatase 4 core regulatory subunit R2 n=1 Tax=Zasmidium cellare ATCC 36951 TaxID=1080233 RepID=A0A6A6CV81_ZASCE|nr:uncharacterized protein M409DRAFT_64461 [Zasmidium cellare ATCC 36951]KAF2170098.1 hypothetical protein M409DRAFT_64461 [Zasmidium cellare ATCC 36951]
MLSTEQLLENSARDGTVEDWPRVLPDILSRLHHNVYNEFPLPSLPLPAPLPPPIDPQVVASTPPQIPTSETETTEQELPDADNEPPANSQSSTKENDAPTELAAGRPPPTSHPGYPGYEITESQRTEEMPSPQPMTEPGTLPPELLSLYESSTRILEYDFAQSPPYTIQRLAELVLRPRKHYRFLPAYLRALDRIVSVSSPVSDFPLPTLHNSLNGGFLTNGEAQVNGISEREGLGSDESLGGALLTPIPWLRNQGNMLNPSSSGSATEGELHSESTETIVGPHGAGSIETVSVTVNGIPSISAVPTSASSSPIASPTLSEQSDASTSSSASTDAQLRDQGAVTQGELLRQEQEAGVVPVNPAGHPMTPRRTLIGGGAAAVGRDAPVGGLPSATTEVAMDDEQPHARGPEVIGMEDMGPQPHPSESGGMLDMEAAVGRGRSKSPQPPPAAEPSEVKKEDEAMEDAGEADSQDVEKEVEKLKEAMDREEAEAEVKREPEGDAMDTGADEKPVDAEVKQEGSDDSK